MECRLSNVGISSSTLIYYGQLRLTCKQKSSPTHNRIFFSTDDDLHPKKGTGFFHIHRKNRFVDIGRPRYPGATKLGTHLSYP